LDIAELVTQSSLFDFKGLVRESSDLPGAWPLGGVWHSQLERSEVRRHKGSWIFCDIHKARLDLLSRKIQRQSEILH